MLNRDGISDKLGFFSGDLESGDAIDDFRWNLLMLRDVIDCLRWEIVLLTASLNSANGSEEEDVNK